MDGVREGMSAEELDESGRIVSSQFEADNFAVVPHVVNRIDIVTGIPFDEFIEKFEQVVPSVDMDALHKIEDRGGAWEDVTAALALNAPYELMVYSSIDVLGLLRVAGHATRAVEYFVGNHAIGEKVFREEPKWFLYAPLRMLIYSDPDGSAIFSMDQPSTVFDGLNNTTAARIGREMDRRIVAMLNALGIEAKNAFSVN